MAKILVVDDDRSFREVIAEILCAEGFHVAQAEDGASALAHLRYEAGRTTLILLDLTMPGMNGRQFREAQLADPALARIPVAVLSSSDADGVPADARLAKSAEIEALVEIVRTLVHRARNADERAAAEKVTR